jgi:Aspartyl protease
VKFVAWFWAAVGLLFRAEIVNADCLHPAVNREPEHGLCLDKEAIVDQDQRMSVATTPAGELKAWPEDPSARIIQTAVPLELVSGFLVVMQGQIGNVKDLKFIPDTGTTHTVIEAKLAHRLQLHPRKSGALEVLIIRFRSDSRTFPGCRSGRCKSCQALCGLRLDEYSDLAEHIDGIIGLDVLSKNKSFMIDYERKMVFFQNVEVLEPPRPQFNCWMIRLYIQGFPGASGSRHWFRRNPPLPEPPPGPSACDAGASRIHRYFKRRGLHSNMRHDLFMGGSR